MKGKGNVSLRSINNYILIKYLRQIAT